MSRHFETPQGSLARLKLHASISARPYDVGVYGVSLVILTIVSRAFDLPSPGPQIRSFLFIVWWFAAWRFVCAMRSAPTAPVPCSGMAQKTMASNYFSPNLWTCVFLTLKMHRPNTPSPCTSSPGTGSDQVVASGRSGRRFGCLDRWLVGVGDLSRRG